MHPVHTVTQKITAFSDKEKTCTYKCSTNETSVLHATNKGSGTQPKTIPVSPERCAAAHSPRIHGKHGAKQMQKQNKSEIRTTNSSEQDEDRKIKDEKRKVFDLSVGACTRYGVTVNPFR